MCFPLYPMTFHQFNCLLHYPRCWRIQLVCPIKFVSSTSFPFHDLKQSPFQLLLQVSQKYFPFQLLLPITNPWDWWCEVLVRSPQGSLVVLSILRQYHTMLPSVSIWMLSRMKWEILWWFWRETSLLANMPCLIKKNNTLVFSEGHIHTTEWIISYTVIV